MKNKKYTQKKIPLLCRKRGIYLNNNILKKNKIQTISTNSINTQSELDWGKVEKNLLTIGIIANRNKKLTQEQINTIKQDLNNPQFYKLGGKITKYFEIKIKMKPNKVITNKGILVRMGKGKGKIKTKGIYILKNMVCIELKQKNLNNKKITNLINDNNKNMEKNFIKFLFCKFIKKYTFFSIITNITK